MCVEPRKFYFQMKGLDLSFHTHFTILKNKQLTHNLLSPRTITHIPPHLPNMFVEKRLRSLSIDSLTHALTMSNKFPSHNLSTILSNPCYLQEHGYTPSPCAVNIQPHMRDCSVADAHQLKPDQFVSNVCHSCSCRFLENHDARDIILS